MTVKPPCATQVVDALESNVGANKDGGGCDCRVSQYAYGDPFPPTDKVLLIATDALYVTSQCAPLCETLKTALNAPDDVCLFAHQHRRAWKMDDNRNPIQEDDDQVYAHWLDLCDAAKLKVDDLDPDSDSPDRVYRITREGH